MAPSKGESIIKSILKRPKKTKITKLERLADYTRRSGQTFRFDPNEHVKIFQSNLEDEKDEIFQDPVKALDEKKQEYIQTIDGMEQDIDQMHDKNYSNMHFRQVNNSTSYHGQFKKLIDNDGKKSIEADGYGEYTDDHYIYKGEFKNGYRHGMGELISPSETYKGDFVNNKKNGLGKIIKGDGRTTLYADFENNVPKNFAIIQKDGVEKYGNLKNGKFDGIVKEKKGDITQVTSFKDGEKKMLDAYNENENNDPYETRKSIVQNAKNNAQSSGLNLDTDIENINGGDDGFDDDFTTGVNNVLEVGEKMF